jgi:hypothetical protein
MAAGTSFAAPVVSGTAAILRRWFNNKTGGANPSPAMTKAMIIGGAIDLAGGRRRRVSVDNYSSTTDPTTNYIYSDLYQGWGLVSTARLLDEFTNHFYKDQNTTLTTGAPNWSTTAAIVDGSKKTRLVLVWTDRASATLGPGYGASNNLYVKVSTASGKYWPGNNFTGAGITGSCVQIPACSFIADTKNNVSNIVIPPGSLTTGQTVTVSVIGDQLNYDGVDPNGSTHRQDFALFGTNIH